MSAISIRPIEPVDRDSWQRLWDEYLVFYAAEVSEAVTAETWRRLLDPSQPILGLIAEADGRGVGILNAVLHPNTWSDRPVCYLEDLFVAPEGRCRGVARALIEALAERGRRDGWHRIYWMTCGDNHAARAVYDRIGTLTRFVRYDLPL